MIGVCRGEKASRGRETRDCQPSVIAGSVEPFVVSAADRRKCGKKGRAAEHPFGVVGMQPDALPLVWS